MRAIYTLVARNSHSQLNNTKTALLHNKRPDFAALVYLRVIITITLTRTLTLTIILTLGFLNTAAKSGLLFCNIAAKITKRMVKIS